MHYEKDPLVSVIVPIYNVANYLERCLKSVINQTYINLEIILVDDGSTDNSGNMCDEYAKKDDRIRVIHKANGGLADARNVALDIMHGEWVTFVDSDDWVSREYIHSMITAVLNNHSQIGVALYKSVTEVHNVNSEETNYKIKNLNNKEGINALLYQKYFTTSAPCKIYKAILWQKIRFPKGKLYEDVYTIYEIFKSAEKITYLKKVVYFYFQRQDSIVRKGFSIKKMDYVENCQELLNDVSKLFPELKNGAISRLVWAEIHVLVQMDNFKLYNKEYVKLWNNIKKFRLKLLVDPQVRIENKLVIFLSFGGTKILRKIYNMKR